MFETARTHLDQTTDKTNARLVSGLKYGIEYVHKDVFLNGLHMVTYVALLSVRFVENRLEKVTFFLRSFKKRRKTQGRPAILKSIEREGSERSGEEVV